MANPARASWWETAWARAGLVALWLVSAMAGDAWAQPTEHSVKAAYLPKFAPFVEWPPRAFASSEGPFVICIVGPDPFGGLLDTAARHQRVGEHAIQVRRLATVSRTSGCHLLYLGQQPPHAVSEALRAVKGSPVLTVTDGAGPPGARGIIHFTLKDRRVRFVIDDQAAADNGLVISSKLMSLALSVRRRG